ncbi:uncharacterized protein LOC113464408 isoform X3 [Ceratina calcarata]|uniref:Uncharacterized protein LOC113464408 isoform X3 n=1 Tax=Ceratina calcarata TaxID=156304 RepID=A0AAJ7S2X7_9HYME|nr:uncharacterized protein LOC113464408 isoform X3 [Ceratina calcarata]
MVEDGLLARAKAPKGMKRKQLCLSPPFLIFTAAYAKDLMPEWRSDESTPEHMQRIHCRNEGVMNQLLSICRGFSYGKEQLSIKTCKGICGGSSVGKEKQ